MVAIVTCCAFALLLLLVLLRIFFLSSASCVPSGRRQQNNDGSRLMIELKARITSMFCFSSDSDAQSDMEMTYMPSPIEAPHSSPGSNIVRKRYKDSHYLKMYSATNIFDELLELEQQTRQDCDYEIPGDIHLPLDDHHKSGPDDSQW